MLGTILHLFLQSQIKRKEAEERFHAPLVYIILYKRFGNQLYF